MGYYSTIEQKPKIKRPYEFREALKKEEEKGISCGWNWQNFWIDNINLEEYESDKGKYYELGFKEWDFKAYEIEDFVKWLNQFEPEGDLILRGEEGEIYGYRFRERKIIELEGEINYIEKGEIK